jgi:plasmid maintenance system antidote protein VapI
MLLPEPKATPSAAGIAFSRFLAMTPGRYFGQRPRYWINLQSRYDMDVADDVLSERAAREVQPLKAAV